MHTLFSIIHRRVKVLAGLAAVLVITVESTPINAASQFINHVKNNDDSKTGCVTFAMNAHINLSVGTTINSSDRVGHRQKQMIEVRERSAKMYGECELTYGADTVIEKRSCNNMWEQRCRVLKYIREMKSTKYWKDTHPALLAAAEKAANDAFSIFDSPAAVAGADTAKDKGAKENADEKVASNMKSEEEVAEEKAAAQKIKEDSSYILTNESLMEMFGDLPKQYQQLANIKNIKIEKLINQTKMKTINSQGITRTMYCKPKCTLGSPMLQSNSTGIDMGIPLVVYDGISEALIEAFGGENPFKKSQIIKLGISSYEEIAKTINDPNINKAMAMPAEQLKQIKSQQRKTQANSNDNSGGSTASGVAADGAAEGGAAEGHHEEGHHEEAY